MEFNTPHFQNEAKGEKEFHLHENKKPRFEREVWSDLLMAYLRNDRVTIGHRVTMS